MEVSLGKIIAEIKPLQFIGDDSIVINEIVALNDGVFHSNAILWCGDKFKEELRNVKNGAVVVSESTYKWGLEELDQNSVNWIVVTQPRVAFSQLLYAFFYKKIIFYKIAPSAQINPSVIYNQEKVNIGENVVIEEGVVLGDQVKIGHNTVILADTKIGNNVTIGSNTTIGGAGFGYEQGEAGDYKFIPHIGNVVLKDNVEIGNNVAIDRAVLGSTLLMENVKVDNLVHISHGVKIGKNSLIIANAMIAGSCVIGENVWVSPSSSIINKTKVGSDSLIGIGSVVLKEVDKSTVVVGVPAKKIKDK